MTKIFFYSSIIFAFFVFITACSNLDKPEVLETDVVVVGGGTGGTAAAIQSARSGARTILVCESPWLGGMLTAAGVSCTDGNHKLPSGIWEEFRKAMYKHYDTSNLATGWVSNFNFEPHVGADIFLKMAEAEPNLIVLFEHQLQNIKIKTVPNGKSKLESVFVISKQDSSLINISAKVFIDGTELGDLMAMAGCAYSVGLEPEDVSGEVGYGVSGSYGVIQDLTYAAILKDYGPGADKTIPQPANYKEDEFACSNSEDCSDSTKLYSKVDAQKMLDYGKMPNQKYMLNWPSNGNDFYTDIIHRTEAERVKSLDSAKQKTLRFVYYIQTKLGKKNIGLADDEFDTPDQLPYIAYHREGRRLEGLVRFRSSDIIKPGKESNLYRTGISVGDYPIDHHHRMYPGPQPDLTFVPVPSYNIPAGALIPQQVTNLIVCDKGISVSNIMNGTTRLQPVILLTGQAAGIMASIAVKDKLAVQEIPVRSIQAGLLKAKAFIMPYVDVLPTEAEWLAVQQVGASGLMMGEGKTEGWSNRTYFYPDSTLPIKTLIAWAAEYGIRPLVPIPDLEAATTLAHLDLLMLNLSLELKEKMVEDYKSKPTHKALTRREIAVWIDKNVTPFTRGVEWDGSFSDGN